MKRTRLRPVSTRRSAENSQYRREKLVFLAEHPRCPRCGSPATQIHHTANRERLWLLLTRYWVGMCFACHDWATKNVAEARTHGYFISINESYKEHVDKLIKEGQSISEPLFYK